MLKTAIAHLCMTWVYIYQTTCCNIQELSNLHKNNLVCIMLNLFEGTADGTQCYDCMKRFSNITLSVTQ
jgi:hypothetical protein